MGRCLRNASLALGVLGPSAPSALAASPLELHRLGCLGPGALGLARARVVGGRLAVAAVRLDVALALVLLLAGRLLSGLLLTRLLLPGLLALPRLLLARLLALSGLLLPGLRL